MKIRIIGQPNEVDATVRALPALVRVTHVSRPLPAREGGSSEVRGHVAATLPSSPTEITPEITPESAAHVLWHFALPGGMEPGGFTRDLIALICRAEPPHRLDLAIAFPVYVAAVAIAQGDVAGVERLQVMAGQVGAR